MNTEKRLWFIRTLQSLPASATGVGVIEAVQKPRGVNIKILLIIFGIAVGIVACSIGQPKITGCEPVGDIRPVCDMQTPEDIAALEDGRHLLLAHFGGMTEATGSLGLFDTQSEKLIKLFPLAPSISSSQQKAWGESDCQPPAPDIFSPHGTHLGQLSSGRWRYLVGNHGREAVEMFEVLGQGGNTTLAWRGCVPAAQETFMNDVVGLSNGDIIFSRMFHKNGLIENLQSFVGFNTGDLWRWNRETGLRILPGTEARQPNGIEISADERYLFANMYLNQQVWKVDAETGETIATAPIANADNSAWGSDGRLWVVTHSGSILETVDCFRSQAAPCSAQFTIVALDPDTMAIEDIFTHRGPPMGAATIAVPQNGRVYMGSFVGDRLISIPDFVYTEPR